jgi:hypothetical protein
MKIRARSIAALAGALSLGAATVTTGAASAATFPRAATRELAPAANGSVKRVRFDRGPLVTRSVRIVSDGEFRVTRSIHRTNGSDRVVFTATDLRTGRTCTLNAALRS